MTVFIIYLFIVFIGLAILVYILATDKSSSESPRINPKHIPETKASVEIGHQPPQEPWTIKSIRAEFEQVKNQIYEFSETKEKPSRAESLQGTLAFVRYSWKLMFKEKEIFTFALLQWAAIGAGYYLWVQMLGWIPPEVWQSASDSDGASWMWSYLFGRLFVWGLWRFP